MFAPLRKLYLWLPDLQALRTDYIAVGSVVLPTGNTFKKVPVLNISGKLAPKGTKLRIRYKYRLHKPVMLTVVIKDIAKSYFITEGDKKLKYRRIDYCKVLN